jgi:hypothetical protein
MNTKYMVIVAAMAVMLIGATALATSESALAGGVQPSTITSKCLWKWIHAI